MKKDDPAQLVQERASIIVDAFTLHAKREVTDEEREAIHKAFATRGKAAGCLRQTAPSSSSHPLTIATWNGCQPNHHKIKVGQVLMLDPVSKAFATALSSVRFPLDWDRDAFTLREMGVWP